MLTLSVMVVSYWLAIPPSGFSGGGLRHDRAKIPRLETRLGRL